MLLSETDLLEKIINVEQNNDFLVFLNLSEQGLTNEQVLRVAHALMHNTHLETLILQCNTVSDSAAQVLGAVLKTNTTLKKLYVCSCKISDAGTNSIADGLRKNKSLLVLDLSDNVITYTGATAIAQALTFSESEDYNNTLTTLSLSNCRIGTIRSHYFGMMFLVSAKGLQHFGTMLDKNSTIEYLALNYNLLDDKAITKFETHVANHPSLTYLDIMGNTSWYIFDEEKYQVTPMCTQFKDSDSPACFSLLWLFGGPEKPAAEKNTVPLLAKPSVDNEPELSRPKIKVRC